MVLAAGQLQSLGTDAAALRRKRPAEQYGDIVAAMRRRCLEDQKKRKEKQVLRARELDASSHALFDTLLRADVQSAERCSKNSLGWNPHAEPGSGSVLSSATAGAPSRTCDISSSSSRRIERPSTLPERLHFHIEVLWARVTRHRCQRGLGQQLEAQHGALEHAEGAAARNEGSMRNEVWQRSHTI